MTTFDLQLSPAVESWRSLRDGIRLAEDAGFDTTWVFDHFAGSMLGGTSMLECFSLLGALSVATDRIKLGSLVANVANRPVGVLTAAAASVQEMSGGRFTLGLGAGAAPTSRWATEHRDLGIELGRTKADRHRRLEGVLDELDLRWGGPVATEATGYLVPESRPPVILGVNSPELAALAGRRTNGINVRGSHDDLDTILKAGTDARAASVDAGTQPAGPWSVSVWDHFDEALFDDDHPDRVRWAAAGVDRVVLVFLEPYAADRIAAVGRLLGR